MGREASGSSTKERKQNWYPLERDPGQPKRTGAHKTPKVVPFEIDASTEEPRVTLTGPNVGRPNKATDEVTRRPRRKSPLKASPGPRAIRLGKKAAKSPGVDKAGPSTGGEKRSAARRKARILSHSSPSSGFSSASTGRSARRRRGRRHSVSTAREPGGARKRSGRDRKRSRSSGGSRGRSGNHRRSPSISSVCSVAGNRAGKRRRRSHSRSSRHSAGRKHSGRRLHRSTSAVSENTTPEKGRKKGRLPKSRSRSRGKRRHTKH